MARVSVLADVAAVRRAQSLCRCGWGRASPGADVVAVRPGADVVAVSAVESRAAVMSSALRPGCAHACVRVPVSVRRRRSAGRFRECYYWDTY